MNLTTGKIKIKENIDLFKCPICGNKMDIDELKSITCSNNHCFDISKNGYVNLFLKTSKYKYDKEMFESRNIICKRGFFDPLIEAIVSLIYSNISNTDANHRNHIRILDAGCGEGYHLSQIMKRLQEKEDMYFKGVGIDLSKDGIQIAAKNYKDIVWCVADIAKIPFMDKKFDIVLNILSPSNYGEFNRILCNHGVLIKVVPNNGYLKELRDILYEGTDKEEYSNEKVIEHFSRNFEVVDTQRVFYKFPVGKEELSHLIKMTPLSWQVEENRIKRALDSNMESIMVDFTIIIGKSK